MKRIFATVAALAIIALVSAPSVAQLPIPGSFVGGGSAGTPGTDFAKPPLYDTYANIAAATCGSAEAGRLAVTTNSVYTARCSGSAWVWFYKGKRVTPPDCTGYSLVNTGTATVDCTKGYIYLQIPAGQAAVNFRMYLKTMPAAPFTFKTLIRQDIHTTNFGYAGLTLRQSSNSDRFFWGFHGRNADLLRAAFFTDDAAGGEAVKADRTINSDEVWLSIRDNNTSIFLERSVDGDTFYTNYSELRTASITADQIGFAVGDENDLPVAMMVISLAVE